MKSIGRVWLNAVSFGGVVSLVLFLYWPSLGNGLVWDDYYYLYDRAEYSVPELWWGTLASNFALSVNYFRPLVVGSFLLDIHVFGGGEEVFHRTNLALFLVSSLVFLSLVSQLLKVAQVPVAKRRVGALLSALVFVASPVLSEVVLWVSGRFDLAVSLFLMVVLLADVRASGWLRVVLVSVAYLFAACSKEMAVAFGLIYPIWHVYLERLRGLDTASFDVMTRRENMAAYSGLVVAGLLYVLLRYLALDGLYHNVGSGESSLVFGLEALFLTLKTLGQYTLLLLGFAQGISPVYPLTLPVEAADPLVWVGGGVLGMGVLLAMQGRAAGLILISFVIALLPVLHIAPLSISGNYAHLRFLTFPYMLVLVMTFPLLGKVAYFHAKAWVLSIVFVLFVLIGVVTVRSVIPMWQSNYALWTWVDRQYPNYDLASVNLVVDASGRGDYRRAIELGEALLAADQLPKEKKVFVYGALGNSYFRVGEYDKMKAQYELIFENYGVNDIKLYHYSRIYSALGRSLIVIEPDSSHLGGILAMAVSLDQYNHMAIFLNGIVQYRDGLKEEGWQSMVDAMKYMGVERKQEALTFLRALEVGRVMSADGYDLQLLLAGGSNEYGG